MQFLMSLNETYSLTRAFILMIDPFPLIGKVFAFVIQVERQRSIQHGLLPAVEPLSGIIYTTSDGVISAFTNSRQQRDNIQCTYYKKNGHIREKCYKLNGFPPGFMFRNKSNYESSQSSSTSAVGAEDSSFMDERNFCLSNSQCKRLLPYLNNQLKLGSLNALAQSQHSNNPTISSFNSIVSSFAHPFLNRFSWILDSSATHHVYYQQDLFLSHIPNYQSTISLPNGLNASIVFTGSVKVLGLVLENVLFIPNFNFNFIFVSSLTRSHDITLFFILSLVFYRIAQGE